MMVITAISVVTMCTLLLNLSWKTNIDHYVGGKQYCKSISYFLRCPRPQTRKAGPLTLKPASTRLHVSYNYPHLQKLDSIRAFNHAHSLPGELPILITITFVVKLRGISQIEGGAHSQGEMGAPWGEECRQVKTSSASSYESCSSTRRWRTAVISHVGHEIVTWHDPGFDRGSFGVVAIGFIVTISDTSPEVHQQHCRHRQHHEYSFVSLLS